MSVGAVTIEINVSLVTKIVAQPRNFRRMLYFWAMKIISTTEAARRLNVSPSRIRAMIGSGCLKGMKVGKVWLIDPRDLEAVKVRKVGRPRLARKTSLNRKQVILRNG
jgi:excisionase family DNA binding protein